MSQIENIAAELSLWANESEVLYSKTNDLVFRNISQHLNLLSAYTYRLLDEPSGGVSSFNTRIGDVVLLSSDVTTALTYTPVTEARTLTINGVTYDLSANRSWTISTATPTLAQVTTAGNTTTNAITVGGLVVDTDTLVVDSVNNRVGIGTATPLSIFDVAGTALSVSQRIRTTSTGTTNIALRIQDGTTGFTDTDGLYLGRSNAINYLWTYENEPLVFATNNTERIRLDASGNFGIGTSSPVAPLDVATTLTNISAHIRTTSTSASTDVGLRFQDGTTGTNLFDGLYLGRASSINYLWTYETEPLVFGTSNSERMRLFANGNVAIKIQ